MIIKFIYSEKAAKFCKISTLLLSVCTVDKSKVAILQNLVAFLEYTNFKGILVIIAPNCGLDIVIKQIVFFCT